VRVDYSSDQESRISTWLKEHLRAIDSCVSNDSPEAALALVYSGIDTLGLLAAPRSVTDASEDTFKDWCEKYVVPRLKDVDGEPITPGDLWGGRCGMLHTFTPVSAHSSAGKAHEFWYRFQGRSGANFLPHTPLPILGLDVAELCGAFKEGALAFLKDLANDTIRGSLAEERAQHFVRWANLVTS
jgi:hypothetical protein